MYPILAERPAKKLATPDKQLVLEGYPRSGNTFFSDFIIHTQDKGFTFAHHTHLHENILLGIDNDVPAVVLLRNPQDCIASFMIYSGQTVQKATTKWIEFYEPLADKLDKFLVIEFAQAVQSPSEVLSKINDRFDLKLLIPVSEEEAVKEVKARIVKRTEDMARRQGDTRKDPVTTACLPQDGRKELKVQMKTEISRHLAKRPRVEEIYNTFLMSVR